MNSWAYLQSKVKRNSSVFTLHFWKRIWHIVNLLSATGKFQEDDQSVWRILLNLGLIYNQCGIRIHIQFICLQFATGFLKTLPKHSESSNCNRSISRRSPGRMINLIKNSAYLQSMWYKNIQSPGPKQREIHLFLRYNHFLKTVSTHSKSFKCNRSI